MPGIDGIGRQDYQSGKMKRGFGTSTYSENPQPTNGNPFYDFRELWQSLRSVKSL